MRARRTCAPDPGCAFLSSRLRDLHGRSDPASDICTRGLAGPPERGRCGCAGYIAAAFTTAAISPLASGVENRGIDQEKGFACLSKAYPLGTRPLRLAVLKEYLA